MGVIELGFPKAVTPRHISNIIFLLLFLMLNWCVVVIKLLRDEAAETQNPYAILKPYYRGWFMWLGFLIHAFPIE